MVLDSEKSNFLQGYIIGSNLLLSKEVNTEQPWVVRNEDSLTINRVYDYLLYNPILEVT